MSLAVIFALAGFTFAFRFAGPVLGREDLVPERMRRLVSMAAAVLLVAVAATSGLMQGHDFAGWARPAGVLVAWVLAARKAPFAVVVVAAAATTALLRLCGVH